MANGGLRTKNNLRKPKRRQIIERSESSERIGDYILPRSNYRTSLGLSVPDDTTNFSIRPVPIENQQPDLEQLKWM
jgi:hypothetical protein